MFFEMRENHTYYGQSHILHGVSLEVNKGETVTLLGRNGVGKSTTLKSIMGLVPPKSGSIKFQGREISNLKPHQICRLGIGFVPEDRRIFPNLTVRQNLMVALKPWQRIVNPWTIDRVYKFFPNLKERDNQRGGNLSGGEQQMLSIGRTLMGNPDLLLVDEPTEGLAPMLVDMVMQILQDIGQEGVSLILVEQAMDVVMGFMGRIYVMNKGMIVFHGEAEALATNEELRRRYLEI
jgi:branched-chain amino acid transport system ATP-binding protein